MPLKPDNKRKRGSLRQSAVDAIGGGDNDFEAWMKSRQLIKPDDQLELTEIELNEEIPKILTTTNANAIRNLVTYSFKDNEYILLPPDGDTITLFSFEGSSLLLDSAEAKQQIIELGDEGYCLPPLDMQPRGRSIRLTRRLDRKDIKASGDGVSGGGGGGEDIGDEEMDMDEEVEPEGEGEGEVEGEGEGEAEGEGDGDYGEDEDEEEETEAQKPVDTVDDLAGGDGTAVIGAGTRKRKLVNMFNYCERAALTFVVQKRSVETETIPPPRSNYGANVLQWVIFDSYAKDFEIQEREREKEKKEKHGAKKDEVKKKVDKTQEAEELNKKYLKCWQILERMINQNIFDEIAQDYRYWEDPSDEFRENEGTLLPLWKFIYEKTKKMSVTELLFNPKYYDLYAVCFGSHDFMKQPSEGALCLFTIKNPSYPDYILMCESGVMCCDIHPKYPFLIAIGMYDGNVAVYDLKTNQTEPLYVSQGVNGKHGECIWQIKWGPDMTDGELNFYTVSSDGRVFNWILMQNKLLVTTIITLYLDQPPVVGPDGSDIKLKGCGTSMTFHPTDPEIFLVGTEEGLIYKCSTAYSSKCLITYAAHYLSVYRIDYNKFNSNIFASCSGDWRIKIWEDMRKEPLFIFDLGSSVGDVKWAPYSSTVFAAVTLEGKVFVFDLNIDKYNAICIQAVVPRRKNRLSRLEFNEKLPYIIVGDDKGQIISLKLSPNLRIMCKAPKKQLWLDQHTMQVQKLDKILTLVRELPDGEEIYDEPSTVQS